MNLKTSLASNDPTNNNGPSVWMPSHVAWVSNKLQTACTFGCTPYIQIEGLAACVFIPSKSLVLACACLSAFWTMRDGWMSPIKEIGHTISLQFSSSSSRLIFMVCSNCLLACRKSISWCGTHDDPTIYKWTVDILHCCPDVVSSCHVCWLDDDLRCKDKEIPFWMGRMFTPDWASLFGGEDLPSPSSWSDESTSTIINLSCLQRNWPMEQVSLVLAIIQDKEDSVGTYAMHVW